MDRRQILLLARALTERDRRVAATKLTSFYKDDGPLRRELYPKSLEFFAAGAHSRERLMLAANRVGKTEGVGCYELTLHLTGKYPAWWVGRRFNHPIRAWAVGDTSKTVREILQFVLLGHPGQVGTGLIPLETIARVRKGVGPGDIVEATFVNHASGGVSELLFKSYDQRRAAFQGTSQHVILLDEESPLDIYTECLLRTMTTDGIIMATFVPLRGKSELVKQFLPGNEDKASRTLVVAGWDDVPHLSAEVKAEMWASIPPFQRDARGKGIPQLGVGAIYPIAEADFVVKDFDIPKEWPRGYGMDVGWNKTCAIWGAWDKKNDVIYLYSEHYRGQAEPIIHTEAIKSRGEWIEGSIDPASRGRSQKDGLQLMELYEQMGLHLSTSPNAREAGLYAVWQRLVSDRLKVFGSLSNWLEEFRSYIRDEDGEVVKKNDHAMDSTRYLIMRGREAFKAPMVRVSEEKAFAVSGKQGGGAWMG